MTKEKLQELKIKDIQILGNTRVRFEKEDLGEIMEDIKHRGLLQPIGVIKQDKTYILRYGQRRLEACKKLGWKTIPCYIIEDNINLENFIADNYAENSKRKNLTLSEFAQVCLWYVKKGYSISEICAYLGESSSKVKTGLRLIKLMPEEFQEDVVYMTTSSKTERKGKIPAKVADKIISMRLDNQKIKDMFHYAKKFEFIEQEIETIGYLLQQNPKLPLKKAVLMVKEFRHISVKLVLNKKIVDEELEKYKISIGHYIIKVLAGEIEPRKDIVPKR